MTSTKPPASVIRNSLCEGITESSSDSIVNGYVAESYQLFASKVQFALGGIYKGYVRLLSDKAYPLSAQGHSITNLQPQSIKNINSGHLPMLTHSSELGTILKSMLLAYDRKIKEKNA